MPGLKVVIPSTPAQAKGGYWHNSPGVRIGWQQQLCLMPAAVPAAATAGLLLACIQDPDPCIFLEPKIL